MTSRHLAALPAAPFARHAGRHRRRRFRSYKPLPVVVDDFSRVRRPALAPFPLAADDVIPASATRRRPYSPKDAA